MNIVVSAASLRTSGGNTIYVQFLNYLRCYIGNNTYYIFVDNDMQQPCIDGVEYIVVNLRSNIKRFFFDYYNCARIIRSKGVEPDIVISLQNTGVYCLKKHVHVIYYHQSIPFYPHKWNLFKSDERVLFFYKYVYPLFVRLTLSANTQIVVQTLFIKKRFIEYFGCEEKNVHVLFPDIGHVDREEINGFEYDFNCVNFIYPATQFRYKEHRTLFQSLTLLKEQHPEISDKIKIYLTLTKEECPDYTSYVLKQGIENNLCFVGRKSRNQIFSMYKTSDGLLFPSTLETIGLPLLEAASMGIPILVSELEYAKEALQEYEGVNFISPHNYQQWADAMREIVLSPKKYSPHKIKKESSWKDFFSLVKSLDIY